MNQKRKITNKNNVIIRNKNKKDIKKIGIFTGIAFIISSVIGVGIFLKNGQIISFNLGNFTLTILSWILTSIAILSLALSLLVIATKTESDLGILQWAKDFLSPGLFEAIKFYFIFLYVPLIVCGDSFYFLQSLQQAFPTWHLHWFYAWIITCFVIIYFIVTNTLHPKMIIVHANIAFYIKLIPIIFFAFIAFILYFTNYDDIKDTSSQLYALNSSGFLQNSRDNLDGFFYTNPVLTYGPEIGFFLSIPAIFFAFDGFYYVVSIRGQLKNPKHSPMIIVLGVLSIAIISILVTLSLLLSTDVYSARRGSMTGVSYLNKHGAWSVINSILNICVCIGCLGIISSSLNFSATLYRELIKTDDLPFSSLIRKKTGWSTRRISFVYLYTYLLAFFLLISFVGTFGFLNLDNYDFGFTKDAKINRLYSFINTITNWESLFTFSSFIFIISGSWVAMKYKKITFSKKHKKAAYLIESGIALTIILFAFMFSVYHVCGNLSFILSNNYFYNRNSYFYDLSNLNGTKIELSNNLIYIARIEANKISWISTTNNDLLKPNESITIKNIYLNYSNSNPYLFALVSDLLDWNNTSINSDLICNINLLKSYINGSENSVYNNLFQDFIGEVINFVIFIVIVSSCIIYSFINKKNRMKKATWFKINNNIFHNKNLEINL